ncbi:thioredoxin family protein [Ruminococcus sp. Marseille-P6503]|uniref:thioredoxin family protein n=1 Tax=Ruminococcus sp. Marseille-P6503 TaxID=2364796 RepID=UPI0013DE2076|nr:thioredoxin family protein [Ruminococcus sp. Marseille-P6503]
MAVLKVTDSDFGKRVLSNPRTVVADVSTDWCPSCKLMEPVFKEASDKHGELDFVSINASDSPETAAAYKVEYVPTLLVFKNGECVKKSVGAMDKAELEEFLSEL